MVFRERSNLHRYTVWCFVGAETCRGVVFGGSRMLKLYMDYMHVSHNPISCDFTTPPFRFSLCRYMLLAFVICISARAQSGRCISLLYICNLLPSRAAPFHSHGHQNPSSASGREGSSRESREALAEGCRGTTRGAALRVPSTFACC